MTLRIVNAMFGRGRGGLERAFLQFGVALERHGFAVTHLISQGAAIADEFPHDRALTTLQQRSQWDIGAMLTLRARMAALRPDAVLSHGARAGKLMRWALPRATPHAIVLHSERFKNLSAFDRVLCVSNTLVDRVVAAGVAAPRVRHVPNFLVETDPPQRGPALADLGFLGRLAPEKGVDRLIEALLWRQAQGRAPLSLAIAGEGPERARLAARAAPLGAQVRFLGWQSDPNQFLAQIGILVAPSRAEVFGLVLLEAWRAGAVAVAAPADGPRELIAHGVDGLLIDPAPEPMANALDALIADRDLQARLAVGGRAKLADFSVSCVGPVLAREIGDLIAAPRALKRG
jgi:glycosyltransferase involved in cell wall biosynthesis